MHTSRAEPHVPCAIVRHAFGVRKSTPNPLILFEFIKMPYLWASYWKPCPSRLWRIRPKAIHKVIHSSCGQRQPPPKALFHAASDTPCPECRMDSGLQPRPRCKPCPTRLCADAVQIHRVCCLLCAVRHEFDIELSPVRPLQACIQRRIHACFPSIS